MSNPVTAFFGRAGGLYLRLIEYFIPDKMRGNREAENQARMFLISHSMGPILGNAVPLAVLAFNATLRIDAIVLAIFITAFWAFPFLLKAGVKYEALRPDLGGRSQLLHPVELLLLRRRCLADVAVAVDHPDPVAVLRGRRAPAAAAPAAISAAAFAVFLTMYSCSRRRRSTCRPSRCTGWDIVSTAAALAYVATMAIYYSRIFDASIALETEVQRRRETADELRKAIAEADRAGSAKAEFLARMSHEIKTPLNAVIGYSQLLREDAVEHNPSAMQDIMRIHDAGQYLLRLVNMILDLSKLEAGRMTFDIRSHRVRDCIKAAVDDKRAGVEGNGNSIVVDLDPELEQIDVDQSRFRQALGAVLENAGQHTKDGLVTVIVRRSLGVDNTFYVRVTDTGAGIDPGVLETLFETFQATRDAASGRFGGTGTNLTVVDRLCHAMGGSITAESMLGIGSTFTITLPVLHTPAAKQAAAVMKAA